MPYKDPQSEEARKAQRKASLKFYYANKERRGTLRKLYTQNQIAKVLFKNAMRRAKSKGIIFNLTIDDIIVPELCPILGILLKLNTENAKDDSPSLDRIIPELGYIKGNVQVISHKANTIKNNGTVEELKKIFQYMEKVLCQKTTQPWE